MKPPSKHNRRSASPRDPGSDDRGSVRSPAGQKRPGKPEYEPTELGRRTVAVMVCAGIDKEMIADCIGISVKTLNRHYAGELLTAAARIKADIAGNLIQRARGQRADKATGKKEIAGDLKAMKFYLETHGWIRSERLLVKDDGSTEEADLSTLSDAELTERLLKLRRSKAVIQAKAKRKP